jgi:hypothetical protein
MTRPDVHARFRAPAERAQSSISGFLGHDGLLSSSSGAGRSQRDLSQDLMTDATLVVTVAVEVEHFLAVANINPGPVR